MQNIDLDPTDRRILSLMQTEPGINATEIGERIGLSQSACWRRIQRLRDAGVAATSRREIDEGETQDATPP